MSEAPIVVWSVVTGREWSVGRAHCILIRQSLGKGPGEPGRPRCDWIERSYACFIFGFFISYEQDPRNTWLLHGRFDLGLDLGF